MRAWLRIGALGVGLLLLGWGLACHREGTPPGADQESGLDPVVQVATARVQRGAIQERISAPGSIEARRVSRIGAEVRGRIDRVFVVEGQRVSLGDPLFQIDPEPYQVALREAAAGLELARAERRQLQADLARARALHRKNVVGEQELEQIETKLAVARAREKQAGEAVALARHKLDRTVARAPYEGSVSERLADEGTTALDMPQTIVLVLQETSELEARVPIPESQLAAVQIGDPARLHVEGIAEPIESEVFSVSDSIDPATRTYLVKMRVANPDHRLKAGVFTHAEILPRPREDALLVPREAILTEDGRRRVLTVRDGRAVAVPVELGIVSTRAAEIVRGLEAGEEIIVGEATAAVAPGMRVRSVAVDEGVEP